MAAVVVATIVLVGAPVESGTDVELAAAKVDGDEVTASILLWLLHADSARTATNATG